MVAHVADTRHRLGVTASRRPARCRFTRRRRPGERGGAWLRALDATQADDTLIESWRDERPLADGARKRRTRDRFMLEIAPGAVLVARCASDAAQRAEVLVDGERIGELALTASAWQEVTLTLPGTIAAGRRQLEIRMQDSTFTSMYYWSYR
jgi:hypothetical protein